MGTVGSISEVTGTDGERVFEWTNIELVNLSRGWRFSSPEFHLSDSSWSILVYRFGLNRNQFKELWLCLERTDPGAAKTITYTLGIKSGSGLADQTFTRTERFSENSARGKQISMGRREWGNFSQTVICRIKCGTPHTGKERSFASCAIQTEFPNSVPCAIQTEVPDSVSCAIQREVPDSVSCAIQTEVPESVSCAIQTEVPDSVISKEKHKHGEFSSLDVKSIASLSDRMKNLLINGTSYDVKICVKNKEFRAHRNILSARSPVFAMMLTHDTEENNTGTIRIEDCDPDSFDDFLLYVYSGRTENLTPSKALQLYYPADKYDFPVLKERCVSLLKSSLSVTSICDVILLAAKHEENELLDVGKDYFARNIEEILVTVSWQKFLIQNPVEANELFIKSMKILLPKK